MIKAIIFDCFGVIISDGLKKVTEELDKTNPEAREIINYYVRLANSGQMPPSEYGKEVSKRLNIPLDEWRAKISSGEHRDDRVIKYIKYLRKRYKTAMLSNVGSGGIERRFSKDELNECFDVVIVSADVGLQKPDPKIYQHTIEKLSVNPEECVFIDDSPKHTEGAQKIGMKTILYKEFVQMKTELEQILAADTNH